MDRLNTEIKNLIYHCNSRQGIPEISAEISNIYNEHRYMKDQMTKVSNSVKNIKTENKNAISKIISKIKEQQAIIDEQQKILENQKETIDQLVDTVNSIVTLLNKQ